jgi:hypothetical protein
MKYIKGQNRTQTYLFPVSLDDAIDADNEAVGLPTIQETSSSSSFMAT